MLPSLAVFSFDSKKQTTVYWIYAVATDSLRFVLL